MTALPDSALSVGPASPSRTWKVDTYCRVKPRLQPDTGTHIDYNFQGPSSSPSTLRISLPPESAPYIWNNRKNDMDFQFTEAFRPDVQQEYVYERVAKDMVASSLAGYNGTIFAYGQTGSGKTYTMTGGEGFAERGLVPRAIHDVFKEIKRRAHKRYRVLISYMEIYKENVYDLLDSTSRNKPLEQWTRIQMMEDEDGEMHLRNLQLYEAGSEEEALNLLFLGNFNRLTSATPMNEASSRSHCIFTLRLLGESQGGGGRTTVTTTGKLHLVDLAGSERMYKTDAATLLKSRIEGRYINLSLHYLEHVILTLHAAQTQRNRGGNMGNVHVPYRNSVMTSILRDSLGGNCRTTFIVTLNTEVGHLEEAISTCRFALRCAQLSSDVLANEEINAEELAASLKLEVGALRSRLAVAEKQRQEVLSQLQGLQNRHKPRNLLPAERAQAIRLVEAFVQDPSEDGSWVYQADRPLLHACLSTLRSRVLELQHQVQLQYQVQQQSASAATSPTQLTDGLTAEDGDLSTLAHFPPPPPHLPPTLPQHIAAHHNPRTPYHVDPLGLAEREAAVRAHHQHPPAPLLGDLRSDALSSAFSEGGADHAGSLSELSLDSPLVMSRRRSLGGAHEKTAGNEARHSHETPPTYATGPEGVEGGGRLAAEFLTRRARAQDEGARREVLCSSGGSEGWRESRKGGSEGCAEEERGLECFRRVMGEGPEGESMAYMHRLLVGGEDARLAYYHRLLTRGALFLKEGRKGRLHSRFVLASPDLERILWRKPGEIEVRGWVSMRELERVTEGPGQRAVTLHGQRRHVTLEVTEEGEGERGEWAEAFRYAIERSRWRAAEQSRAEGREREKGDRVANAMH